jgi:hypothetical protein
VRAEEEGVMLDFSSIFFFGLSLRPKIRARGLMRKSLFFLPFFLLVFLGTELPKFPRARKKQEGALKNHPKGQKKEERGGRRKEKKRKFSLYSFSLSLSLSLSLVPHKDTHN